MGQQGHDLQHQGGSPEAGEGHRVVNVSTGEEERQTETDQDQQIGDRNMEETKPIGNGITLTQTAPSPSGPDVGELQDQLRAVTKQRSALSARVQELETVAKEAAKLRDKLSNEKSRHRQEFFLLEAGITSTRARRSIRREYRDEIAEMAEDKRPDFKTFVNQLKADDFYGRLFAPVTPPQSEAMLPPAQPQSQPRTLQADPNGGAVQQRDPARPLDETTFRSVKSRSDRRELAKRHGLIKG